MAPRNCKYPLSLKSNKIHFGVFLILFSIVGTLLAFTNELEDIKHKFINQIRKQQARRTHRAIIDNFMKNRQKWNTSTIGSKLFKFRKYAEPRTRKFMIYIHNKEILQYEKRPLQGCSVHNCIFTRKAAKLPIVDAVLINMHFARIPNTYRRSPRQIWIYWDDESPANKHFRGRPSLKKFENMFNWTMTYRTNADVPIPYGRTVPLEKPMFIDFDPSYLAQIIPNWERKRRDKLVTILMSNCLAFRMTFLKRLQKYIPVDIFGKCSSNKTLKYRCPGHIKKDCDAISEYVFYLAIENSSCREYLTEKVWYNAYSKGAVPIIMGPPLSDCERLLPPNSYLYISTASNETEIKNLAKQIIRLGEDDDSLLALHKWRNHFKVVYEHGGYGNKAVRLCRLCEGLNYNDARTKMYNLTDLKKIVGPKFVCGIKKSRRRL